MANVADQLLHETVVLASLVVRGGLLVMALIPWQEAPDAMQISAPGGGGTALTPSSCKPYGPAGAIFRGAPGVPFQSLTERHLLGFDPPIA